MAVLFHFVFELVKIGILSSVYAAVLLSIMILINKSTNRETILGLVENKRKFWKLSFGIIYAILFAFMFTYWGDHGLGDEAYIPIGHFKVVYQSDGNYNYIENARGTQLNIKNFTFDNGHLYAETDDTINAKDKYVAWNLLTDNWKFYSTQADLEIAVKKSIIFQDFWICYKSYWNGWRFWLLP
jgi:hypothetical protein